MGVQILQTINQIIKMQEITYFMWHDALHSVFLILILFSQRWNVNMFYGIWDSLK